MITETAKKISANLQELIFQAETQQSFDIERQKKCRGNFKRNFKR
jgi:hypothetical protein